MKLIIREAKIIDSQSPFHNKKADILIVDGFIKKIATSLPNTTEKTSLNFAPLSNSNSCLFAYLKCLK